MATFLQAYTDLLDYANRTSTELGTQAKREINLAINWLQRQREWKFAERLIRVTIPANSLFVNLSEACDGTPRTLLNCVQLESASGTSGKVIDITSYEKVLRERRAYQRAHEPWDSEAMPLGVSSGHNDFVSQVHGYKAFLVGANNFGLYPTNTTDVYLLINLTVWIDDLVDDSDTNFFLDQGYDLVLDKAFIRFTRYLKEDRRIVATAADLQHGVDSFIAWDSQVRAQLEQNG